MAIERLFASIKQDLNDQTSHLFEQGTRLSREGRKDEADTVFGELRALLVRTRSIDTILRDVLERFDTLGIEQPTVEDFRRFIDPQLNPVPQELDEKPKEQQSLPLQEEMISPKLVVNLSAREIQIDGRVVKFRKLTYPDSKHVIWNLMILVARSAYQDLSSDAILELAKQAGAETDKRSAGEFVKNLREIIEVDPSNPQLLVRLGAPQHSRYQLNAGVEFIEEEDIELGKNDVSRSARMTINHETREIEIDGRRIIIENEVHWRLLLHLARNRETGSSTKLIDQVVTRAGSNIKTFPGSTEIRRLRKTVEIEPKDPQIITRFGPTKDSLYRLNAEIEFVGGEVIQQEKKIPWAKTVKTPGFKSEIKRWDLVRVELPDGQEIQLAPLRARIIEAIKSGSKDNPVFSDELVQRLYIDPAPIRAKTGRLVTNISNKINPALLPFNWRIANANPRGSNKFAGYFLEKITEGEKTPEGEPINHVMAVINDIPKVTRDKQGRVRWNLTENTPEENEQMGIENIQALFLERFPEFNELFPRNESGKIQEDKREEARQFILKRLGLREEFVRLYRTSPVKRMAVPYFGGNHRVALRKSFERWGIQIQWESFPEGWITKRALARRILKTEEKTVGNLANEFRQDHPEWFKIYLDLSGKPSEHYSPELVTEIDKLVRQNRQGR